MSIVRRPAAVRPTMIWTTGLPSNHAGSASDRSPLQLTSITADTPCIENSEEAVVTLPATPLSTSSPDELAGVSVAASSTSRGAWNVLPDQQQAPITPKKKVTFFDDRQPVERPIRMGIIKIHTGVLTVDNMYSTLSMPAETTAKEMVRMLLDKFRMRSRDPNLYHITMQTVCTDRQTGLSQSSLARLADEERPIQLQAYFAWPGVKVEFILCSRPGEFVKVQNTCLMAHSYNYTLPAATAANPVVLLETPENFDLYEVCRFRTYDRLLNSDDCPLQVQTKWPDLKDYSFELRRRGAPVKPVLLFTAPTPTAFHTVDMTSRNTNRRRSLIKSLWSRIWQSKTVTVHEVHVSKVEVTTLPAHTGETRRGARRRVSSSARSGEYYSCESPNPAPPALTTTSLRSPDVALSSSNSNWLRSPETFFNNDSSFDDIKIRELAKGTFLQPSSFCFASYLGVDGRSSQKDGKCRTPLGNALPPFGVAETPEETHERMRSNNYIDTHYYV